MSKPPDKHRRALGKGLSALLPSKPSSPAAAATGTPSSGRVGMLPISQIEPNHLQPRTVFDPERMQELADSIEKNGIIQPLVVRRKGDQYELVAGRSEERRVGKEGR